MAPFKKKPADALSLSLSLPSSLPLSLSLCTLTIDNPRVPPANRRIVVAFGVVNFVTVGDV